jgi:two-component system sensor histidine kinase BaeS
VTLLLAAVCIVGSMVAMMQWSFDRGFLRYITFVEQLAQDRTIERLQNAFVTHGGWPGINLDGLWRETRFRAFYETQSEHVPLPRIPPRRMRPPLVLLDAERRPVLPPALREVSVDMYQFRPIQVAGQVVGHVGFLPSGLSESRDLRFVEQQTRTLLAIAALMVFVCAVLAVPFARQLVRPLQRLSAATRALAAGDYKTRIGVHSSDELGQLSRDFNHLAQALDRNEHARQQWMADIAHELRTPLAVAQGQVEAFQDGIREPNPSQLDQLHRQITQLSHLVNDLHELAMADIGALNYSKDNMHLFACLRSVVEGHRMTFETAAITLELQLPEGRNTVYADESRLRQLFGNLLANSAAYTNAGGRLRISASYGDGTITILFEDTAPGVPAESLPFLFDRLYRVESSRNRRTGGSGLGLAICKNIVEAHAGEIDAEPSVLGGLAIRVKLPLAV